MKTYDIDTLSEVARRFKVKGEEVPTEINLITPTVAVGEVTYNSAVGATTSGGACSITVPSNKEFYLLGYRINIIKDATCDVADSSININATPYGTNASQAIDAIQLLTLTAQEINYSVNFSHPLRLLRGSAVNISATNFTAGKLRKVLTIWGYTKET